MYILLTIFGREKYPMVHTNSVGLFCITSIAQLVILPLYSQSQCADVVITSHLLSSVTDKCHNKISCCVRYVCMYALAVLFL